MLSSEACMKQVGPEVQHLRQLYLKYFSAEIVGRNSFQEKKLPKEKL